MGSSPPVLAALALLLCAPAAGAATITVDRPSNCGYGDACNAHVALTAEPGERNAVTLLGGGVVRDAGAPLRAVGPDCAPIDEHTVKCSNDGLVASLGDGDDTIDGAGDDRAISAALGPGADRATGFHDVDGGEGDDVIDGGPRTQFLAGGPGDDVLRAGPGEDGLDGGPGRDRLEGGAGNDRFVVADGEPDVVDGGADHDTLEYTAARAGITVDLARGFPLGAPGEDDRATGAEGVIGTRFGDRLAGTAGPDDLDGRGGRDVIEGRDGADRLTGGGRLFGGAGPDFLIGATGAVLDGGAGDDRFSTTPLPRPRRASVLCGAGRDLVETPPLDVVPRGCETVGLGAEGLTADARPRLRGRRMLLAARCPGCRGTITISAGGREVGRARLRDGSLRVALRRPLRRGTPIRFDARVRRVLAGTGGFVARSRSTWRIVL